MSRIKFAGLFFALALTFGATASSASTITHAVGTCRPGLKSFSTISDALAATPAANVIVVCPGTYNEQVQITQPVTLEGVSNGGSDQAIIAPPPGGLNTNAADDFGNDPVDAELWVDNVSGPVNISNIVVDGTGNGVPFLTAPPFIVGIFYQNSSGTVSRVDTRNQSGDGFGIGIWAEGGSSNPLVTIENSSVHDYDDLGIEAETNSATPGLTTVIKGNEVTTSVPNSFAGIDFLGAAVTVTSNVIVNPGSIGIEADGGAGSISANTVAKAGNAGIVTHADSVSLTANKIFGSPMGINLQTSVATIQGNTITQATTGIAFNCNANPNVHSNIISSAGTAVSSVPSATTTSNTYFNVGTSRTGGC